MKIQEKINSIANDIQTQAHRLALYTEMATVFAGINFDGVQVYFNRYSDGETYCEFSPEWGEKTSKDLRAFIHSLARKFHMKFDKTGYDATIQYAGKFSLGDANDGDARHFRVRVTGVVPATCQIVETRTPLTDEEIAEAKQEALSAVKTERVERKLVCNGGK